MSRPVMIKATAGVRNDVLPERLDKTDLVAGINVDLDESGQISRRKGLRRVVSGADVHSLGLAATRAFFVDGTTLYELSAAFGASSLRTALAKSRRMNYLDIGGPIIASNGIDGMTIDGQRVYNLGLKPPPVIIPAVTNGDMPAGEYGVTMTYIRADGTESGAPQMTYVSVPNNGGLGFSNLPVSADPYVIDKRVYVTEPNGEVPFLAMTLVNGLTMASYTARGQSTFLCSTQFKTPLPAGDVLALYNGCAFSAVGNVVWYSEPYHYELCDQRKNYLLFDAKVTLIAPVSDGIFVGTESETVFLAGPDPANFQLIQVAPVGSVQGTLTYADPKHVTPDGVKGKTPMWVTKQGIVAGGDGGAFVELTSDRYVLPDVSSGAGMYQYKSGTPQYLSVLY